MENVDRARMRSPKVESRTVGWSPAFDSAIVGARWLPINRNQRRDALQSVARCVPHGSAHSCGAGIEAAPLSILKLRNTLNLRIL